MPTGNRRQSLQFAGHFRTRQGRFELLSQLKEDQGIRQDEQDLQETLSKPSNGDAPNSKVSLPTFAVLFAYFAVNKSFKRINRKERENARITQRVELQTLSFELRTLITSPAKSCEPR